MPPRVAWGTPVTRPTAAIDDADAQVAGDEDPGRYTTVGFYLLTNP